MNELNLNLAETIGLLLAGLKEEVVRGLVEYVESD